MKLFLGMLLFLGPVNLGAQTLTTFFPVDPKSTLGVKVLRILEGLEHHTGIHFQIITDLPRARAKTELVRGTLDCLAGGNRTYMGPELPSVLEVPGSLLTTKMRIITLGPPRKGLGDDFKAYRLICERDSAGAKLLAQEPGYQWSGAATAEGALRMLVGQRGDGVLMNEEVFYITRDGFPDLKNQPWVLHPRVFFEQDHFLYLSPGLKALVPRLAQGIKIMTQTGELARIMKP